MEVAARRIVVVGTSCAGKTTFARALASKLALDHVELDALHWGPHWTPRADFLDRVRDAVSGDSWVVDGNYSRTRVLFWDRAELIVWLDYEMGVVLRRALSRTVSRAWHQTEMWAGNRESFRKSFLERDSILLWVLTTWRRNRHRYRRELGPRGTYAGRPRLHFRRPEEAEAFLRVCRPPNTADRELPAQGESRRRAKSIKTLSPQ